MTYRRTIQALWPLTAFVIVLALAACGGGDPESLEFGLTIQERQLTIDGGELVVKQNDEVTLALETDEDGARSTCTDTT